MFITDETTWDSIKGKLATETARLKFLDLVEIDLRRLSITNRANIWIDLNRTLYKVDTYVRTTLTDHTCQSGCDRGDSATVIAPIPSPPLNTCLPTGR